MGYCCFLASFEVEAIIVNYSAPLHLSLMQIKYLSVLISGKTIVKLAARLGSAIIQQLHMI